MLLPPLYHHFAPFGRPIASIERLLWRPLCLHSATTATTTMVLPPLCLLCTTCCDTTAVLEVQATHKGRAAAVTQKQNFLGLGDHWASCSNFWSLIGGTKVTAMCKGGFRNNVQRNFYRNETIFIDKIAFENVVYQSGGLVVSASMCWHRYQHKYMHKWITLCPGSIDYDAPGPQFNIKMSSYQYRKSHCGDKTVVRSSYFHNGISYTGKMSSLYWIGAQLVAAQWHRMATQIRVNIGSSMAARRASGITWNDVYA